VDLDFGNREKMGDTKHKRYQKDFFLIIPFFNFLGKRSEGLRVMHCIPVWTVALVSVH
jgi:hypothetical protein